MQNLKIELGLRLYLTLLINAAAFTRILLILFFISHASLPDGRGIVARLQFH